VDALLIQIAKAQRFTTCQLANVFVLLFNNADVDSFGVTLLANA
jgi:hypothetical protein